MKSWYIKSAIISLVVVGLVVGVRKCSKDRDERDSRPLEVGNLVGPMVQVVGRGEQNFSVSGGIPTIVQGRESCIIFPEMRARVLAMKNDTLALVEVLLRPDSLGVSACRDSSMVTVPLRMLHRAW